METDQISPRESLTNDMTSILIPKFSLVLCNSISLISTSLRWNSIHAKSRHHYHCVHMQSERPKCHLHPFSSSSLITIPTKLSRASSILESFHLLNFKLKTPTQPTTQIIKDLLIFKALEMESGIYIIFLKKNWFNYLNHRNSFCE